MGCCLAFKFKNKEEFAQASCRECDAFLIFKNPDCESEASSTHCNISISFLREVDQSLHTGTVKRQIRKANREELKNNLKSKTPLKVYEEILRQNKSSLNPLTPNIDVIRKISSENNGDAGEKDEFFCLRKLNQSQKRYGIIRSLSEVPDYVNIFFSKEQENVIKNTDNFIFCLDATGGVVHSPFRYESKKYEITMQKFKPVFLYLLMLTTPSEEFSIPVSQMLSSDHSTESCSKWLKMVLKATQKSPFEIRIDCASMLMSACSLTYNKCSTSEYLKLCYESLFSKKILMKTIIRLDKSHIIKIFCNWKSWAESKCGIIVKYFYVNILRSLVKEIDFEKVKKVCNHMITMMMSKYESDDLNISFNFLHDYITHSKLATIDEILLESENSSEDSGDMFSFVRDEELYWIQTLFEDIEEEISDRAHTNKLNAYYMPRFKSDVLRVMKLIPMWSNILLSISSNNHREVCTTGTIESQFNIIKNNIFKYQILPTKSHKFIETYMDHVDAQIILFNDNLKDTHSAKIIKLSESKKVKIKSFKNTPSEL